METDHSADINRLRAEAHGTDNRGSRLVLFTAADLLEIHDDTGISLDEWPAARLLVESLIGHPITENGA